MGAYLSEPITEKVSTDEDGDRVACGASSMQGWRVTQEDAHNCIIDFDLNTSLFAVYDGHGGHEVALYCSQKLPEFIKNTDAYKNGDMKQALIEAFLGFDATIASPEVVQILKEMVSSKDKDETGTQSSDDETEDVKNLYEEACMPLEKVMEKYKNPHLHKLSSGGESCKMPFSPYLRAKVRSKDEAGSSGASCSKTKTDEKINNEDTSEVDPSVENNSKEQSPVPKEPATEKEPITEKESAIENIEQESSLASNSSVDVKDSEKVSELAVHKNGDANNSENKLQNGDVCKDDLSNDTKSSSSLAKENGESIDEIPKAKGKGKAIAKSPVEESAGGEKLTRSARAAMANLRSYTIKNLYDCLKVPTSDSEDSDDDQDSNFEGEEGAGEESDVDEDGDENDEEGSVSETVSEEEDDDEEDDLSSEDESMMNSTDEPGSDSGCTAVVAMIRGNELFVANAGDSRCVVCRNGKVVEMSFDHKPENEEENSRIVKAGGKVTIDGRVNGGLNLSRAIGDHAYKQNKELSDKDQMITALPDITTITLNPTEDDFMVLACDGIWNFMSNEEVVEFVGSRLKEGRHKISQICEEMFDHCLAPNTMGDGTGCDNMTAIIIQFKTGLVGSAKRSASPIVEESTSKRAKVEDVPLAENL